MPKSFIFSPSDSRKRPKSLTILLCFFFFKLGKCVKSHKFSDGGALYLTFDSIKQHTDFKMAPWSVRRQCWQIDCFKGQCCHFYCFWKKLFQSLNFLLKLKMVENLSNEVHPSNLINFQPKIWP